METTTGKETKPFTLEEMKDCILAVKQTKELPLPKGMSWFTKLMAKFGWHRKYEIVIIDQEKLKNHFSFQRPKL